MNHAGPGVGGREFGHSLRHGMRRLFWGKARALNVPTLEQTEVNATKPKSLQPRRRTTINRCEKKAYTRTPVQYKRYPERLRYFGHLNYLHVTCVTNSVTPGVRER
jgi:hypothetical protein